MMGLGSCKNFNGMQNFDPARFNGTWYVMNKVGTRSDCLVVTYNLMEDNQSFEVEEVRRPPYSDVIPLDFAITNTGSLTPKGGNGKYTVRWNNGIIPFTGTYAVPNTDYDNFAIDIECQEFFGFLRRISATILSRNPEMDDAKVGELLDELSTQFEIPRNRMNAVDQTNCVEMEANDFKFIVDENGIRSALKDLKKIEYLSKLPPEQAAEVVETFEN
ncbi:apolipoprotein D-like [Scylla paramamosain]|uniref:apolipoprotein D-like n=1 Tax=Scylla paramamosain TaxID=85552 RepID=UPI0030828FFE